MGCALGACDLLLGVSRGRTSLPPRPVTRPYLLALDMAGARDNPDGSNQRDARRKLPNNSSELVGKVGLIHIVHWGQRAADVAYHAAVLRRHHELLVP